MSSNVETLYTLDFEKYNLLYKAYVSPEKTKRLLSFIDVKDREVLDLCCGEGRLSVEAVNLGAKKVIAVDANPNIHKSHIMNELKDKITIIQGIVPRPLYINLKYCNITRVFCQQAINYWFSDENIRMLSRVLSYVDSNFDPSEIQFCFNTFSSDFPRDMHTKTYEIGGFKYCENSHIIMENNQPILYHYQACAGVGSHLTKFRWITQSEYRDVLNRYFLEVKEYVFGHTSIWVSKGLR